MATRGKKPGSPKTGGRVHKSLDKGERQLVSSELAGSILTTFERLGGVDDMLSWASANRTVFYTQVLSRLFPAPQRGDEPDVQVNTQVNIGSDFEAARRIAFTLAKAAHEQEQQRPVIAVERTVDSEPFDPKAWVPPTNAPDMPAPEPVDDFQRDREREQWAQEVHLTPEERAAKALCRETVESDISNYRGSAAEQPGGSVPRPPARELSPGERRRAVVSRRGRDLL